jgi:hypothetical protein
MPVKPVRKSGKVVGYRWGSHGKLYKGSNAKKKAGAQGRAAYASGYRGKKK